MLACGHGLSGYRLRFDGARPQYLCRRRSSRRRSTRPCSVECTAWLGDGAGASVYRHLRGSGHLVGLAVLACARCLRTAAVQPPLPLEQGAARPRKAANGKTALPARFWVFAAFVLLYGICETMNGNWASLYMTQSLGASTTLASLALTVFWGSVTAGRILFAAIGRWFPEGRTYRLLPFV